MIIASDTQKKTWAKNDGIPGGQQLEKDLLLTSKNCWVYALEYCMRYDMIKPPSERLQSLKEIPPSENLQSLKKAVGMFAYYSNLNHELFNKIQPMINIKKFVLKKSQEETPLQQIR